MSSDKNPSSYLALLHVLKRIFLLQRPTGVTRVLQVEKATTLEGSVDLCVK